MTNSVISTVKVEMYSTAMCPFCAHARRLLERKGIKYTEYRIDKESDLREEMISRSNRTSVPQIFIDNRHVGGFDDLAELDVDDELDGLLQIC